jgi:hypothetical protein
MGSVEKYFSSFIDTVTSSVRRFTAFLFIFLIIGMLIGARIAQTNASLLPTAIIVPAFLALVAYFYTEAAIIFFIIFALVFLFL